MKKLLLFVGLLPLSSLNNIYADSVDRHTHVDTDNVIWTSTRIVGGSAPDDSNISISSGVVRILGVYISSAGVNSELRLYNNNLAGATTNYRVTINTNDAEPWHPVMEEFANGLVFTSTAVAPLSSWSQGSFRIVYRRVR